MDKNRGPNAAVMLEPSVYSQAQPDDKWSPTHLIPFSCQLLDPVTIQQWMGNAIMDTGATFTFIQITLWKKDDLSS